MKQNSGQALLIVLLSLSVVMMIVLYIVSRSISDVSISTKDEESLRAFSAAEAGIERALVAGSSTGSQTIGTATFDASVSSFGRSSSAVVSPISLYSGETTNFWFVGHNSDGSLGCSSESCFAGNQLNFCFADPGTSASTATTPALEVSIYYTTVPGDYTTLRVARVVLDPYTTRRTQNNFSAASTTVCTIDGQEFAFQQSVSLNTLGIANATTPNVLQYATVRMLYNTSQSHKVGLNVLYAGNSLLPSQGSLIDSTGSYGNANRRIEVFQLHPVVPPIFESAIYSSSSISK